jgi:hypothetical protein
MSDTFPALPQYRTGDMDECRACAASIVLADDGAWCDESGACGCGVDEHEPGGFNEYAHYQRSLDTPWWDDVPHPAER